MIKIILLKIEDVIWNLRCRFNYYLHGPYGVSKCVENMPFRYTIKYLRKYGASIGHNCIIDSGLKLHRPDKYLPFKNLVLGNNVYLGHNILLDLTEKISFSDNTAMGANCQIWTHTGDYKLYLRDKNDYKEYISMVALDEGAVCYSGVLLNPGSIVGKQSRVLAMSMVSNKIPDRQIWGGVPAKFIKERDI